MLHGRELIRNSFAEIFKRTGVVVDNLYITVVIFVFDYMVSVRF
jgi:hypothetical protein